MKYQKIPEFLSVKTGDYVAIKYDENPQSPNKKEDFWIGKIVNCIGGARDPNSWTLFQVVNIDNAEISIINADTVQMILKSSKK